MNVYIGELYKEVEYIQSSGTQRIDTGVNVSNDSTYGFELKCNFDVARESVMDMGGNNSDVRRYGVQVGIGNWQISRPMYGTNDDYATFVYSPAPQTGVDYTMIYNYNGNRSWSLNGTTYASNLSVGSFTYNYNWNIFCQTLNNGTYTRFSKFKLYYMKIYHGTTLVRDFVPCYRVRDNVIGLFDKVENKFYTNAGTGTFTKGNDVKVFQPELKNAYIGEYKTIEYDFTTQNILTFFWQGDNTFPYGYTAGSGYYSIKQNYSQGMTLWTLPSEGYVNNIKKLTLKYNIGNNCCSFALTASNGRPSGGTGIRGWVSSGGPGTGGVVYLDGGSSQTGIFASIAFPTGDVIVELDFVNATIKYGPYSSTLASSLISAFRTQRANGNMRLGISQGNYNTGSTQYTNWMQECIIEY